MSRPTALSTSAPALDRQFETGAAANGGDRAQLAKLAAEFESMLMLEMIKQMRQSMLGDEGEDEGLGADTFSGTIDSELARHLSQNGGLGLQADMLRAWDRQQGVNAPEVGRPEMTRATAIAPAGVAVAATASTSRPVDVPPVTAPGGESDDLSLEMSGRISSRYGWRRDPFQHTAKFHGGIDLAARYGTEVPAAADGSVVSAGEQGGYGLTVVVRHAGGYETRYAHLSSLDVRPGDAVEKGTMIGRVGSTGRSTAPHLHFEVTRGGQRVDPDRFVRNLTSDIKGQ